MDTRTIGALLAGIVIGGGATALGYNYPKGEVTEQTYCKSCGAVRFESHENQFLGRRRSSGTKSGMLASMMDSGQHQHEWAEPNAYVFPTFPQPTLPPAEQLREKLVGERLQAIDEIEHSPDTLVLLREAIKNDDKRARGFVHRLLDAEKPIPVSAIATLLERDRPWADRWADVDAFYAAYKCDTNETLVRCHLPIKGQEQTVIERTPTGGNLEGGVIEEWLRSRAPAP